MNKRLQVIKYLVADYFSALIAWSLFFVYRKVYPESEYFKYAVDIVSSDTTENLNLLLGLAIIPLFWVVLYAFTGQYESIYRKYRLRELGQTLLISLIGVLIIFFTLLLQ